MALDSVIRPSSVTRETRAAYIWLPALLDLSREVLVFGRHGSWGKYHPCYVCYGLLSFLMGYKSLKYTLHQYKFMWKRNRSLDGCDTELELWNHFSVLVQLSCIYSNSGWGSFWGSYLHKLSINIHRKHFMPVSQRDWEGKKEREKEWKKKDRVSSCAPAGGKEVLFSFNVCCGEHHSQRQILHICSVTHLTYFPQSALGALERSPHISKASHKVKKDAIELTAGNE